MTPKVLLVEDSTSLAILYKQYVKDEAFDFFHVETGQEAKTFIERYLPQVVILDLQLPDISGQEILDWIRESDFPISVIIATAHGSVNVAVDLLHKGADDFLEKPIVAERLKTSIHVHLKKVKLENMVEDLKSDLDRGRFHGFIGSCVPMQNVYKTIDAVAPTNASVFVVGESGTGKEVCAEAIHKQSNRRDKPFIALNCGAIPKDLMESEIFGHLKGSFTGATTDRKGAAALANGGTLFLDELCEMDLELQKKLLRFLQTSTFTPLGDSKERKVDVRIVCATNRDPLKEVEEGRFREDLYYRVHVIPVEMPPLRERSQDITTLANHFLRTFSKQDGKKFTGLSKDVEKHFKSYPWPGNVRQLQNVIRNIVILNDDKYVQMAHLPAQLTMASKAMSSKAMSNINVPNKTVAIKTPAASDLIAEQVAGVSRPTEAQAFASQPATDTQAQASQVESATARLAPEDGTIANSHFEPNTNGDALVEHSNKPVTIRPMWMVERETIQQAIDYCDGNVLSAAVLLELSPSTVYRKKQAWEAEDEQQA